MTTPPDNPRIPDIPLQEGNLYREDTFTDLQAGTVKQLSPVQSDGSPDASRPVRFTGHTRIMTPAGTLPLDFEIEAATLPDALRRFSQSARVALAHLADELDALQRENASRIVTPGPGAGPNLILP